jgi:hypothetical protein
MVVSVVWSSGLSMPSTAIARTEGSDGRSQMYFWTTDPAIRRILRACRATRCRQVREDFNGCPQTAWTGVVTPVPSPTQVIWVQPAIHPSVGCFWPGHLAATDHPAGRPTAASWH